MANEVGGDSRRARERRRLLDLKHRQPAGDPNREPGVLLSDAIREYAQWFGLIDPFDEKNLKPANYKLTVGDQFAINGEIKQLSDETGKNKLVIPPFTVAIIETGETISMPRFLIGRWNIQVRRAYQGLVWVGGPQVDAGYVGHLFCPIYNLSNKPVTLLRGEPIAVIDFVKTTSFIEGKSIPYGELPEKILFEDYNPEQLVSGLVAQVEQIERFGNQLSTVQSRTDNFVLLTFGAVSVLFAALTIFVTRSESGYWWSPSLFLISGLAIFLSMSAWLKSGTQDWAFGRIAQAIVIAMLVLAIIFHIYWGKSEQKDINDLKQQVNQLKNLVPQSSPPLPLTTPQVPQGQATPPQTRQPLPSVPPQSK